MKSGRLPYLQSCKEWLDSVISGLLEAIFEWPQDEPPAAKRHTEREWADRGRGDEQAVPYEGRHVLEVMGIKTTDAEAEIEAFLISIEDFPVRPLIRCYNRHLSTDASP